MKKALLILLFVLMTAQTSFATEQVFFYHTDQVGTPLAMTNSTGTVVWKADYRPFGEEQSVTASMPNDKQFVGKEKDEETGLSYFGARYMDAKTGRFISPDPVRAVDPRTSKTNEKLLLNPQRLNTYAYALNNPYRFVDPDGNSVWDILDFAFFGHSFYQFAKEPTWSNAADLGLNTVGLLPLIPSLGVIKAAGEGISALNKASDASEAWRAVSAARPLNKMGHAQKHLSDFQKIDPSLKADDVAKILEHVRRTGNSTPTQQGGKLFESSVGIGGKNVRVQVVESASGNIKTGYPVIK